FKDNSTIVGWCNTFLQNIIALNLRFIGVTTLAMGIGYNIVSRARGNTVNVTFWIVIAVMSGILGLLNVNVTALLKHSTFAKFIGNCFGVELTFKWYREDETTKVGRKWVGVGIGLIAGIFGGLTSLIYSPLIIVGLFFFFLILYKVEAGVGITVLLMPIIPTMAVVGLSLLCLVSLIIKGTMEKDFKWKFDGLGFLVVAMLAIYLIAGITSFAMVKSLSIWGIYFAVMIFYFVIINTLKTKKQVFDLLTVLAISGALVCLYGLAQYIFGWNTSQAWMDEEMFTDIKMRIYSTLGNPNVLGEYILLVLPVSVGLMWVNKKPLPKFIFACMSVVAFAAIILTFSRGCWIGLVITAAIFITFVAGKLWGLALIALPFVPMLLPESIINRFASIGDMKDSSTSYRVFIWIGTLAMMKDYWLSGIGMGSDAFSAVYPFYSYNAIVAPHAHNLFLQILVESGAVGILAFLAILFVFYKKLMVGHKYGGGKGSPLSTMIVAIGAGVAGFLVQGMFDNCFYNYRVMMVFWTVLAIGISCVYVAKNIFAERERENEKGGKPV
ncbi:MAG: O-antigen ligase family protein, partial [Oscillospiraceae bacterium]